jgi:hypothetical protein
MYIDLHAAQRPSFAFRIGRWRVLIDDYFVPAFMVGLRDGIRKSPEAVMVVSGNRMFSVRF